MLKAHADSRLLVFGSVVYVITKVLDVMLRQERARNAKARDSRFVATQETGLSVLSPFESGFSQSAAPSPVNGRRSARLR